MFSESLYEVGELFVKLLEKQSDFFQDSIVQFCFVFL